MANPASTDTITSTTPAGAAEQMMPFTIAHLVMIGVAVILTVVMIWWGNRLWRGYRNSRAELDQRGETVEIGGNQPVADSETELANVVQPAAEPPVPIEPPAPPPVAPAPPPIADVVPATPEPAATGDLTTLKGLGPKAAALLTERGVSSIAQLAALSPDQALALDAELGSFRGRMTRDRWHEQARLLSSGDRAGYEAIFGKLG